MILLVEVDFLELGELYKRCIRIMHIARKPGSAEFNKTAKVTGLGMILFGFIGFIVSIIFGFIG